MSILPPDPVYSFRKDMGHIHCLNFCVRGEKFVSQLLAGTEKGTVYFWDLESNRLQLKQDMGKSIQSIHSFDYKIITQEKEGQVKLWSVKKSSYQVESQATCVMSFCKSILINKTLLVPQEEGCVDILNINDLTKVNQLNPGRENLGSIMALQEVNLGSNYCVMAGYETGDVVLWDLNTFQPCGHIQLHDQLTSLTFDPISKRAVSGSSSDTLEVFTINNAYEMAIIGECSITNKGCNVVKVRSDSKIVVSGGWDRRIRIFSCKTFRVLTVLNDHEGPITDIQFSPFPVNYWESNIMAVSGTDGLITLWDLYN
ncbi:guanine nucleotide-binding protein subunit beta-like protein 1 [Diorhabda carinulata]|uniref:guanine nucleotide-binding protein subunit beta-like protein 1 n=1 Tax=Diorhabda carinulata TaxID=1163345 RepID=UPI0025A0AC8C|nr:guanine nucleotide-binding protein subunit beta-like protein 1 [Diorhabda carinulata]